SGLFLVAPIMGHRSIPAQVKVGLAILFAIVVIPGVPSVELPSTGSTLDLVGLVLCELMVGILLGFFFTLIFKAAEMAGAMTGFQIGLVVAQAFDPNAGGQVAIIGRFWIALAGLIFLAINGHHLVIQAFNESFQIIPPGQMVVNGDTGEIMVRYTAYALVLAVKIASPVIVTLVLTDVAMGTISKLMPTMNIFIVGFPLKVGVGLIVTAMALPVLSYVLQKSTAYLNESVGELLQSMGKA
ncbi:MAG: flagellar biosynthetic protein FliR, partial [Candidatus Zixiibacteriota bacterium]